MGDDGLFYRFNQKKYHAQEAFKMKATDSDYNIGTWSHAKICQVPLLLTWFNFNPGMDKPSHTPLKCGMKWLIHSLTASVQPLTLGKR